MAAYAELDSEALSKKMEECMDPDELLKIMAAMKKLDEKNKPNVDALLKEPELGEDLENMMANVHQILETGTAMLEGHDERMKRWDEINAKFVPAMEKLRDLYAQRVALLYEARAKVGDIYDTLMPAPPSNILTASKEDLLKWQKEMQDTKEPFKEATDELSELAKNWRAMPEYKEITLQMEAVHAEIDAIRAEKKAIMNKEGEGIEALSKDIDALNV